MIRLAKISLYELPELIAISYQGDNDLLQKYHIAPMDLQSAIESTFGMIYSVAQMKKAYYYKVVYQKQPIGYVVTFDGNFLYSYGIAVKFRKKDILIDWWEQVKQLLDDDFGTMLYGNNYRASDFLQKQGMKITQEDKQHNVLTFINSI